MNQKRNISWLRIACWIGAIEAMCLAFLGVMICFCMSVLDRELGLLAFSAILCALLCSALYVCWSEYQAVYRQRTITPSPWLKLSLGIVLIVGNLMALLLQYVSIYTCWQMFVTMGQIFSDELPLIMKMYAVVEVLGSLLFFVSVPCVLVAVNLISIDLIRRLRTSNVSNGEPHPNNKMLTVGLGCALMMYAVAVLFILFVPQKEPIDNFVYNVTEQPPQFPGGDDEYQAFVDSYAARIEYLPDSICNPIVSFIVELDGRTDSAQIARSSGVAEIDSIALHIVDDMPKFTPAKQRDRYVRARRYFRLNIFPPNSSDRKE